ncbi:hypothetical protein EDB81DRAFT_349028 [Dactylonectria macrodidyma]|uniref:Uncharacterized protein n=1 Tax=Dactylonectria macrodidyma TaxID=307937 RepID=A0A9P9FGF9_9HYPO|nr:hypothetical protein EDB81DRAFT_349028 [Dactylonectria macrodidyma]
MRASMFIASRSSRHRIAAIALYRALLRAGQSVDLPRSAKPRGSLHPIVHLVKQRVRANMHFTSLRLVYGAMTAGYKFLTMFTKAQDRNSPEYAMIVTHMQRRIARAATSRREPPPRSPQRIHFQRKPPFLTKISGPGEPPEYISTVRPRPKPDFNGARKVPVYTTTAEGLPFLRFYKPQSRVLSKNIHNKQISFKRKIYKMLDIENIDMPFAKQEDDWEALVQKQLKAAGLEEEGPPEGPFSTYQRSQVLSKLWYEFRIDATWKDWLARGRALNQIAEDERSLAMEESRIAEEIQDAAEAERAVEDAFERITQKMRERRRDDRDDQALNPTVDSFPVTDIYRAPKWQWIVQRNENQSPKDGQAGLDANDRAERSYRHNQAQSKRRSGRIAPGNQGPYPPIINSKSHVDSVMDAFEAITLKRKNL